MALTLRTINCPPAHLAAVDQRSSHFFASPPHSKFGCDIPLRTTSLSVSRLPIKIVGRGAIRPKLPVDREPVTRKEFPSEFLFGAGCSAFQVEGAPLSGGRGNTIWDSFVHLPGRIENGDVQYPGCDFYNLFEDDIKLVKDLGFDAFRFSISWTRIYPHGDGQVSNSGLAFYNTLINAILKAGMKPIATLFHWETPQDLENDPEVLGWRTKNIVPYFVKLADTCFKHFGDRVKTWATVNEMWTFSAKGYAYGVMAPGRCTPALAGNDQCMAGDSRTEPYLVGHHLLLAHAKVYQLYKNKYKKDQGGVCGFNPCHFGAEPYSNSNEDKLATERYLEFFSGWQIDPVIFGDYPKSMRTALGDRLPTFTKEESEELKNSCDFLGHNYYSAYFIKNEALPEDPMQRWFENDSGSICCVTNADGKSIGPLMGPSDSWIYCCPTQMVTLLEWLKKRYGNVPCYITENGVMDKSPDNVEEALNDTQRCTYIQEHLTHLSKAINDKHINVKGYFYWAFVDNFEWNIGYNHRFGLVRVDLGEGQEPKRTLKNSAKWFQNFLGRNT